MKKLFLKKSELTVREVPLPYLEPGAVLVQSFYSCISSGTELSTIKSISQGIFKNFFSSLGTNLLKVSDVLSQHGVHSTYSAVRLASIKNLELGYSSAGKVVAAAPGTGFKSGDFVACAGASFASHAEYLLVPQNCVVKVADEVSLKDCSISAIASVALEAVRKSNISIGSVVCVWGLGLLGQLVAQFLKISGCTVVGVDINQSRLDLALELGCDKVFLANDQGLKESLNFFTEGHGVDSVLICASGKDFSINDALSVCRKKARAVLVSSAEPNLDRSLLYEKEIDFVTTSSYGPGRYEYDYESRGLDYPYHLVRWTMNRNLKCVVNLIENKQLKIAPLIDGLYELENASLAYDKLSSGVALSALFKFDQSKKLPLSVSSHSLSPSFATFKKKKLSVGIVGVGGFAKSKLLPFLEKNTKVVLRSLADKNAVNLVNMQDLYGFEHIYSSDQELLRDPELDAVIIATPHKFHAQQIINAINAGKYVFVEKPLAISMSDAYKIKKALRDKGGICVVDFNRSFSPMILKLKSCLAVRNTPLVVNCRVNAGEVAKNSWLADSGQGGRIVGEACHFIELFLSLVGSEPTVLSVSVIKPNDTENSFLRDNINLTLEFADGSVCNLIYSTLANKSLDKERIEIFWDGRSVQMSDFKSMKTFGVSGFNNLSYLIPDKGHSNLLNFFIDSVLENQVNNLNSLWPRHYSASVLSVIARDLAEVGGGRLDLSSYNFSEEDLCPSIIKSKQEGFKCAP